MQPLENDEVESVPIKPFTQKEIDDYYSNFTFDFGNRTLTKLEDVGHPEVEFQDHTDRLKTVIVNHDNQREWDEHTDLLHDFFRNPQLLQNYFICSNKAFLKFCEISEVFDFDFEKRNEIRSFHLCEGPGYFIEGLHLILGRIWKLGQAVDKIFEWHANTLNPYFENISCFDKLVDDSHIRGEMKSWHFGPFDDGDIRSFDEEYLVRIGLAGTCDFVTADGSTNTQGQQDKIEETVADIIRAEVEAALILLRSNGRLILKTYRFCFKDTQDVMMLLADNFSSIKVIKPMASRPGSSERYVVCDGFGGKTKMDITMLVDCDEFFVTKQVERIRYHYDSFVNHKRDYDFEQREQFLEEMRSRLFTSESMYYQKQIAMRFPRGRFEDPSPWLQLYGHDLIRRNNPSDLPTAIDNYINQANVFCDDDSVNAKQIMAEILDDHPLPMVVGCYAPLYTNDSLFIDPIAFQAIQFYEPRIYYDMFEQVSTITGSSDEVWRKHLTVNGKNHRIDFAPEVDVRHILIAMAEGIDNNMQSFTIGNMPVMTPPLFLSRLSASMFTILLLAFERAEPMNLEVRWSGLREDPSMVRQVLDRILSYLNVMPETMSVRLLVPLRVLDLMHSTICYRNVVHLTVIRRDEGHKI